MGSLRARDDVLKHLAHLRQFPVLSHDELLTLVAAHALWGRGLSPVDAHLLGSVTLVPGARLWTRASDCSALPKSAESPSPKEPPAEAPKQVASAEYLT